MGIGIAIPILFLHNSICFRYRSVRDLDMAPFWIALQFLTILPIELKQYQRRNKMVELFCFIL